MLFHLKELIYVIHMIALQTYHPHLDFTGACASCSTLELVGKKQKQMRVKF